VPKNLPSNALIPTSVAVVAYRVEDALIRFALYPHCVGGDRLSE